MLPALSTTGGEHHAAVPRPAPASGMRRPAAAFAVGVVLACAPPFPGEVIYEGQCLQYASTDTEVCAGSFALQESFIEALMELTGVDEALCPVQYSLVNSVEEYCGESAVACNHGGTTSVYASTPIELHEITHAVAIPGGLPGPRAFREGFAEVFDYYRGPDPSRVELRPVLMTEDGSIDGSAYYTMALFVRFLLQRHGWSPFLEFMSRTDHGDSYDKYSPIFEEVFGESLDAAIDAFADYPTCRHWDNRIALVECGQEAVPWDGNTWQVMVDVDCSQPDVVGPMLFGDDDYIWTVRGLEIAESGEYWIVALGDPEEWGSIRVTRCGSCWDAFSFDIRPSPDDAPSVELPAGRYFVEFTRRAAEPGELGFAVLRPP